MATATRLSKSVLDSVKKSYPPSAFLPQKVFSVQKNRNVWHPPKFSARVQAGMRKACLTQGIDPLSIGLPPLKEKGKLRDVHKGHKHERLKPEREAKIAKNLEQMPKKIKEWKEAIAKEAAKHTSSMPF